ncbi:hypothetical protein [Williamsia sp.]|uniref:hypothetical protein n=1 Tax=Williamsia sp. TaxID=1872085 RepID=UPI001A22DAD2|nr:hypothetical protein [Williamsia sp.]MBJ7288407.1 hypothetical protein [Williamsia sp.]
MTFLPRRLDGRPVRRSSRRSSAAVGALALCVLIAVAGCADGVDGDPVAASGAPSGSSDGSSARLDRLSLTPADFPASYPATRLRSEQAGQALADLSGHAPGTTVTPSGCEPPQIPSGDGESVVLVGMSSTGGALTVVTTTSQTPLSDLEDQIRRCASYTTDIGGVTAQVSAEVLPPSPVESQQSLAFRRVVRSGQAPTTLTQSTTVLAAQNDGVRVFASYLSFSGSRPDGEALDAIFTKAVQKSRSG